ncbi:SET domain-containing protein [Xylaria intraflava]|nr:SET domain-containing protein [Xylaria intraflava]
MTPKLPEGLLLKGSTATPNGRSIATTRGFESGEIIATFSSPSIAIPESPSLATTCSSCLEPSTPATGPPRPVRLCTGCRTVAYCSTTCQKLDWEKGGHKAECKVFKRVRAEGHDFLPTPTRALVHILLRPEASAAMADLEAHFHKFLQQSGQIWDDMRLQAMAALHYVGREVNVKSLAETVELSCKLQINSFSRLDPDFGETGLFVDPALSMLNHSCIPNAFVRFIGPEAVLHAYRKIEKGEEVKISYVDGSIPLSQRQETFKTRYHFTCSCPRCKDDLDVYQVCRGYPHLDLNSVSLEPDLQKKLSDSQLPTLSEKESLSATTEDIYPWCSTPISKLSDSDKAKHLRRCWLACEPLRHSPGAVVAIEPLPTVLAEANKYFVEQGSFEYSLCISSFLATRIDPYQAPAPFAPQRLQGMFTVAQMLANMITADPGATPVPSSESLRGRIFQTLGGINQLIVCQTIAELILYYAPATHSKGWRVTREAKALLTDLEAIKGRERETMLVKSMLICPTVVETKHFFKQSVLDPLRELSGFCLEIMDRQLGS